MNVDIDSEHLCVDWYPTHSLGLGPAALMVVATVGGDGDCAADDVDETFTVVDMAGINDNALAATELLIAGEAVPHQYYVAPPPCPMFDDTHTRARRTSNTHTTEQEQPMTNNTEAEKEIESILGDAREKARASKG